MDERTSDLDAILGSPRKALLHMAVPLLFAILVTTLQSFIDGIWCAGLGPDPLSAITISAPVHGIIVSLGTAVGVGASAAIARSLGAGDKTKADSLASQSVVLTVAFALVMMPIMYLAAEPIISVSGGGYNIGLSMDYVMPYIICTLPLMANGLILGLIRSEGAAKRSSMLAISASLINMALDPVLIYGLGMGVNGAAWATCISFIITDIVAVYWYHSGAMHVTPRFSGFRFDGLLLKEILVVTVPMALEMTLIQLLVAPEQAFVASCGGSDGLVVYTNAFRYVSLVMIPASAISSALITVISVQIGQNAPDKVWATYTYAIRTVFLVELALGIVLFVFADPLISIYTYSPEMAPLHDDMVLALRIYSVVPIFNGIMHAGNSVLKAMRKAMLSTVISVSREFIFLAFYWIASRISMEAIFWSLDLTNFIVMIAVLSISFYVVRAYISGKRRDGAVDV